MRVTIDTKRLDELVAQKTRFFANPGPALERTGSFIMRSIMKNFNDQGRPRKWAPSFERPRNRRARLKAIANEKPVKKQKTLRDTGRLMNSIAFEVSGSKVIFGTNVIYAAIHHFGGTIKHPGGTPYINIGNGKVIFMRKSTKFTPGKKTKAQKGAGAIKKALRKGGEVKYTKAHKIKIPARPYMMIQPDDYLSIRRIMIDEFGKA